MNVSLPPPLAPKSKRGRKPKYGEATKLLTIRVPVSKFAEIKVQIKKLLQNI